MNKAILLIGIVMILLVGCNKYEEGKICVKSTGDCPSKIFKQGYEYNQMVCDMDVQRMCFVYNETVWDRVETYEQMINLTDRLEVVMNCWEGCRRWEYW